MKKILTIIALALALVMLFSMAACGKEEPAPTEAPAPTQAVVEETEAPVEETEEPELPAEPTPSPRPTPDADGMMKFDSELQGFSFQYNEKYIAMVNPVGNAMVYAGDEAELPFCSVFVQKDTTAADYLASMASAAAVELEGRLVTGPAEAAKAPIQDRDVYYIMYIYTEEGTEGNVVCVYYAEDQADGSVAVFNSVAIENATDDVDSISRAAIETFKLAE